MSFIIKQKSNIRDQMMICSNKRLAQLAVEYCIGYQIDRVVISPGSRNAPLTIGFTNHSDITTYSIVDERCAAFFGLGMAQQTQKPVALICTSGSALLNYYPAIAEAFYSNIPLIVISADRPKHLIDIGDGQTIRQENVFKNHSLYNANLREDEIYFNDNVLQIEQAIQTAILKKGPVHINIPFDEPLYDSTKELPRQDKFFKIENVNNEKILNLDKYASIWNKSKKKLILIGTHFPNKKLESQLAELAKDESVLIFTETTSNLHNKNFVNSIDKLIFPLKDKELYKLQPDILLTLGGMIVSKKIKQVLRTYPPKHHWHIDTKQAPDTFHCLSHHFKYSDTQFLTSFSKMITPVNSCYRADWILVKEQRELKQNQFLTDVRFSDLKVFDIIIDTIPKNTHLQLGNSSIIRYSQLFNINESITVFCNRGTSGIDGSTSTAIGASNIINNQTVFITGDISFFYDSNALWNRYIKNNFRIILVNNGGGGIFKFIPGPSSTNALDYFVAPHNLTAKQLSEMYQFEYASAENEEELKRELNTFYLVGNTPKILEVFTPSDLNDSILKEYFNFF